MPSRNSCRAAQDALAIWQAGVDAVTPREVFRQKVSVRGGSLWFDGVEVDLGGVQRIVIVAAGKAAASMVHEFVSSVGDSLTNLKPDLRCIGWANCPEGTFDAEHPWVRARAAASQAEPPSLNNAIFLHAARPAGMNSPTEAAVQGTQQILHLLRSCTSTDLVLCLLSGGGSALLVSPPKGITLDDKRAVAEVLAAAGANIEQLNTVRRCLSEVKGGGLTRACAAPRLISLIISDVLGDPLEVIASGPTVQHITPQPQAALDVLRELGVENHPRLSQVTLFLRSSSKSLESPKAAQHVEVLHCVLANNADAVDAAGVKAVELGYRYVMQAGTKPEGDVSECTRAATDAICQMVSDGGFDCWISGGEPSVKLPSNAGKGGRNQQLALGVMQQLVQAGWPDGAGFASYELAMVSGGTDGEDGPTDAAGAFFDQVVLKEAKSLGLDMGEYYARADAYHFFEQTDSLVKCGPTGTNVCDLRVALFRPR